MSQEDRVMRQLGETAIGLTWHIPLDARLSFNRHLGRTLMGQLAGLHNAGRIAAVLPFRHRRLEPAGGGAGSRWSGYWLLVLAEGAEPDAIWKAVERAAASNPDAERRFLRRAEILRPQPGLEMYFPRVGGLRREPRWHWLEYAVSRPDKRAEYCRDQYLFSARVIQRFYDVDAVTRCIGLEHVRYLRNGGTLPTWDVVHITGFAPTRLPQIGWTLWRSKPYFDSIAHEIGRTSALHVVRSWRAVRVKYQTLGFQDRSHTLWPVNDG
jgi:hypothetical protein